MKILFVFALLFFTLCFSGSKDGYLKIREINLDTSNFKRNVFERMDIWLLIEANYEHEKKINLEKYDALLKILPSKHIIRPRVFFNPLYLGDVKKRYLIIKRHQKIFFTVGISCLQLYTFNKRYFTLTSSEKKTFIIKLLSRSVLYIDDKMITINPSQTKFSYKSIYYPHDPNKPDPIFTNPIINQ